MGREKRITDSELVGKIYDAALEPELWLEALQGLEAYLGAHSSFLGIYKGDANHPPTGELISSWADQEVNRKYTNYFRHKDPGYLYKQGKPTGLVTARNLHMSDSKFAESEYFRDFARHLPADVFYQAGMFVMKQKPLEVSISVQRGKSGQPFTEAELKRFGSLYPHINRAIRISELLEEARTETWAHRSLVERLGHGAVLLDDRGKIVFMNPRAEEILHSTEGLSISRNRLLATDSTFSRRLDHLIKQASGKGGKGCVGGELLLNPTAEEPPLKLYVLPMALEFGAMWLPGQKVCAAVLLQTVGASRDLTSEVLREVYGLTPTETKVALALAKGKTLTEITDLHHTSMETVRSQVKSVFSKMGVRRQSEVVMRVLSIPELGGETVFNS